VIRVLACKHWYPDSLEVLFNTGSFFMRCDSLAYGCLGAVLFTQSRSWLNAFYAGNLGRMAAAGVLLIVAPVALRWIHVPARVEALTFDSMQAIGFGLLLLQSLLFAERGFYRALNWGWVRQIGVLSYSIYIWQQMFCGGDPGIFGRATNAWWTHFPVWLLVALVVANVSYYVVEKPLFRLRAKFRVEEPLITRMPVIRGENGN
jgi:peptidoglycan/LPS O-acetylase OafA/YrhL